MARSEGRILVEIWDDPDFIALLIEDQRNYLFLFSQRDTAHTGVLPLRERRWSNTAMDATPSGISASLRRLEAAGFVVVDESTEEVLVRSLIRRDKIFRQPNVLRAAQDQMAQIASRKIRSALLTELDRIAAEQQVTGLSATVLSAMREALAKGIGNPSDMPTPDPSDDPTGIPTSDGPGERGVVTAVSSDSPYPDPLSPEPPEPASPTPPSPPDGVRHLQAVGGASDALPSTAPRRRWSDPAIDADPHFAAFWDAYPNKVGKGNARQAWLKALRKGADPDELTRAATSFRDDPRRDPGYTAHPTTWLNGERWTDQPAEAPPSANQRPFWEN